MEHAQTRVCIVGICGLLGSRVDDALRRHPDFKVTAGVMINDASLSRMAAGIEWGVKFPEHCLLDHDQEMVDTLNAQYDEWVQFRPFKSVDLSQLADVVIDCTSHGFRNEEEWAKIFNGPIILQEHARPKGQLIAVPRVTLSTDSRIFRHGGCLHSGVTPVLAAFGNRLLSARISCDMQEYRRVPEYLTIERLTTLRVLPPETNEMVESELSSLCGVPVDVESISQRPGPTDYGIHFTLKLRGKVTREEIRALLKCAPHMGVLHESQDSTFPVNLWREQGVVVPPILVFGRTLRVSHEEDVTTVRFSVALHYREVTVLPLVDALQIICRGMEPEAAQRSTDRCLGYSRRKRSTSPETAYPLQ